MYDTCLFNFNAVLYFMDLVSNVHVETCVFIYFVIYMVIVITYI